MIDGQNELPLGRDGFRRRIFALQILHDLRPRIGDRDGRMNIMAERGRRLF